MNHESQGVDHASFAPFARLDRFGPTGEYVPWPDALLILLAWCLGVPQLRLAVFLSSLSSFYAVSLLLSALPPRLRALLLPPLAVIYGRIGLACLGVVRVRRVGFFDKRSVAVVANHVSTLDILLLFTDIAPSFVAKASLQRMPFIGRIATTLGCVFVERERSRAEGDTGAARSVRERLLLRAAHPETTPRLVLFPEGTTTNGDYLLPFKSGAFLTGAPVQPVVITYLWRRWCPSFESIPILRHLFLLLSMPCTSVQLTYLPLYIPSAAEAADPAMFAANVRHAMLTAGGLKGRSLGLSDKRSYHEALRAAAAAEALEREREVAAAMARDGDDDDGDISVGGWAEWILKWRIRLASLPDRLNPPPRSPPPPRSSRSVHSPPSPASSSPAASGGAGGGSGAGGSGGALFGSPRQSPRPSRVSAPGAASSPHLRPFPHLGETPPPQGWKDD